MAERTSEYSILWDSLYVDSGQHEHSYVGPTEGTPIFVGNNWENDTNKMIEILLWLHDNQITVTRYYSKYWRFKNAAQASLFVLRWMK